MGRRRRTIDFVLLTVLANVLGCGSDRTPTQADDIVNTVTVNLGVSELRIGQTVQADAIARSASGGALSGVTLTWSSSNPSVARVTSGGLVTAVAPGKADITAAAGARSATVTVTVLPTTPASKLAIVTQPGATAVSSAVLSPQPTIQLRDASDNPVSMSDVVVTASLASGSGTLVGTLTATTNASGAATFTNLSIVGSGAATLRFAATGLTAAVSSTITVAASAATKLSITQQPSATASSGTAFSQQPTIQLRDASDNAVSQANVVVTAVIASGSGTLNGTMTATTNASGVATFSGLRIFGLGAFTLSFSAPGLGQVTSSTITVSAGPASKLSITTQPSSTVQSGVALAQNPVIQVTDAGNNPIAQAGVVVTAAIASGGGTLSGTTTATTNASGVATFTNLVITGTAGARTLTFSAPQLTAVTSSSITVTAAAASQVAITTQPSATALSGAAFATQPVVRLRDAAGNNVSQSGVTITASIASGTGTLGGTATATTNTSGTATFTNLSISGTAGAFTLRFSSGSLTAATSGTITISVAGPASQIAINDGNNQSAARGAQVATAPSVVVKDQSGNPVSGVTVTFAVTAGGGSVSGATQTTGANGVARVGSWTLGSALGANTLTATSAGLTGSPVTFTATSIAPPALGMYYNSSEPGCGTDPSIVLCDDFESGSWYTKDCDEANASGGLLQTKGWCGTIYARPTTPPGAARCGAGVGAAGTNCAADGGQHTGSVGGRNMADHDFGPNKSGYNELWLRYYIKPLPGYVYGAQKMINFNATQAGGGGISIGGPGSPFADGALDMCTWWDCNVTGEIYYYRQNQGTRYLLKDHLGVWSYVEMHVKLNTPGQKNGIWELWVDDCGANGVCTGTPTLRSRFTTVEWQGPTENKQIRSVWFENWANPGSVGTELYDQLMVKTNGMIGFAR